MHRDYELKKIFANEHEKKEHQLITNNILTPITSQNNKLINNNMFNTPFNIKNPSLNSIFSKLGSNIMGNMLNVPDFNKKKTNIKTVNSPIPANNVNFLNKKPNLNNSLTENRTSLNIFQENANKENSLLSSPAYDSKLQNYNNISLDVRNSNSLNNMIDKINPNSLSQLNPNSNLNNQSSTDNSNYNNNTNNVNEPLSQHLSITNYLILSNNFLIFDALINLENALDNKANTSFNISRCAKILSEEIILNKLNTSMFNVKNINQFYEKAIKYFLIFTIYVKFIVMELQFDSLIKTTLKKIISGLVIAFLLIYENYVLTPTTTKYLFKQSDMFEKYRKTSKYYNASRGLRVQDILVYTNKNLESVISQIKLLSNSLFKFSLLKPVHVICLEMIKFTDVFSLYNFTLNVMENILFGPMHLVIPERKQQGKPPANIYDILSFCEIPEPYLPPFPEDHYCLILDMDETLIHFFFTPSGGTFLVRPGAFQFIKHLAQFFEIVVFTAGTKEYADLILDCLDRESKYIKYRLYRQHITIHNNGFSKDLSKLGRDLSKSIIIDNTMENFKMQPNNGLGIRTWTDDIRDTQLFDLERILTDMYYYKVKDVREIIKKIKDEINSRRLGNASSPYSDIDIKKYI